MNIASCDQPAWKRNVGMNESKSGTHENTRQREGSLPPPPPLSPPPLAEEVAELPIPTSEAMRAILPGTDRPKSTIICTGSSDGSLRLSRVMIFMCATTPVSVMSYSSISLGGARRLTRVPRGLCGGARTRRVSPNL